MPKKRKKPARAQRNGSPPARGHRPDEISLGGPRVPSRGWAFQALIDHLTEAGQPPLQFTAQVPDGYESGFTPQPDAPRAPLQAGWYLQTNLAVPVYNWVYSQQQLADDEGALDLRRRGFALYMAHSASTRGRADAGFASAEVMETWEPIVAPDPAIVAADHYGGHPPAYSAAAPVPLPAGAPRTVGVLDVDYARVAGRTLPERWDVDVVGLLVMERQGADPVADATVWRQRAFHTFRDHSLADLNAAVEDIDLLLGHNLFDGDYRCLRTYGELVDVGALAAKTVDTLYAARRLAAGAPARLDLTTLARAQGLRERAKEASRTQAHRGIATTGDAEDRWYFQPVSDDCEVMLELWLQMITRRRLRTVLRTGEPVEYEVGDDALRLLLEPPLTSDTFIRLLTTKGTVYPLHGAARNESIARIHREVERQRATGTAPHTHPPAAHRQRCAAPGDEGGIQCDQLIAVTDAYCRNHRSQRRCRGNPALDDTCTTVVGRDLAHCPWHRMTALYVPLGQRLFADFTLPLPLQGWDRGSDWGYDTGTRSFFARLYRNGRDPSEEPTLWLSGIRPDLGDVVALAQALQEATGAPRRAVVDALTADRRSPQQRAAATQNWEPAACADPCPCGTDDCGHGAPCADDECAGHDIHTMRDPTGEADVTAWQDCFECCEGCSASVVDRSLPQSPWGEMAPDGTVTVYGGVAHHELGME
ncbi:hypothetical protein ACFYVL_08955 [Streptomyces sp. NPDC004111]|uniref:hypothetical protein n=1 Tax=Streptomyces sp. NPDC004111 TaxID=3364690 RepID=UPI0036B256A7